MKGRKLLCSLTCGLMLAATPYASATVIDGLAAVVNGTPITIFELKSLYVDQIRQANLQLSTAEANAAVDRLVRQALQEKIDLILIDEYARRNNLRVSEGQISEAMQQVASNNNVDIATFERLLAQQGLSVASYRQELRQQLLMLQVNRQVSREITLSDEEVASAFHSGRFYRVPFADIGHILIGRDGKTDQEARAIATELAAQIQRSEISFAKAAQSYSEGPQADEGGKMSGVKRGRLLKELDEAIFSMSPSEVRLVSSAVGYHIVQLIDITFNREMTEEDAARTKMMLMRERQDASLQEFVQGLRKQATISYKIQQ